MMVRFSGGLHAAALAAQQSSPPVGSKKVKTKLGQKRIEAKM